MHFFGLIRMFHTAVIPGIKTNGHGRGCETFENSEPFFHLIEYQEFPVDSRLRIQRPELQFVICAQHISKNLCDLFRLIRPGNNPSMDTILDLLP